MNTLTIFRGKSHTYSMIFVDEDSQPVNLTGKTIRFMGKRKEADADADAVLSKSTEVDPGGITKTEPQSLGLAEMEVLPEDTAGLDDKALKLVYHVEVVDVLGPHVADIGKVEIKVAVIKATA